MKKLTGVLVLAAVFSMGTVLAYAGEGCGFSCGDKEGKSLKGASIDTKEMKKMGFEVATLSVDGMHCGDCAKSIKDALESTKGVKVCDVNLKDKTAKVCYDKKKVTLSSLIKRIQKEGFEAKRIKEAQAEKSKDVKS